MKRYLSRVHARRIALSPVAAVALAAAVLVGAAPVAADGEFIIEPTTYYVALNITSDEANSGCDAPFAGTGDLLEDWSDDPDAAIQAAIDEAASGDIIHICAGTWNLDSSGDRPINSDDQLNTNGKDLTFEGEGASRTILVSDSYGRIVSTSVLGGSVPGEITIRDITFSGGTVNWDGGAVVGNGVTCVDSVLSDNDAGSWDVGSGSGGAIYSDGPVLLDGCTLNNNSADGSGGALSMKGHSLTVRNSRFNGNSAAGLDTGRELGLGYGMGGAIYRVSSTASVEITNSYFTSNESANTGGAVSTRGASESSVTNSRFEGNHSDTWGGALDFNGEWTLDRVVMRENSADDGGGAIDNSGGDYDVLIITGSQFIGNTSPGEGGEGGGAILNNGGGVFVTDSLFQENTVDGFSSGGAIHAYDVEASTTRFIGNAAYGGGAIYAHGSGGSGVISQRNIFTGNFSEDYEGGAIRSNSALESSGDTFRSNRAGGAGGAASAEAGTVVDAVFAGNTSGSLGGALLMVDGSITNSIFSSNAAASGGALYGGELVINRSQFISNRATLEGGAASLFGSLRVTDTQFSRNSTGLYGGGLAISGYRLSDDWFISGNRFTKNTAGLSGGAIDIATCVAGPRAYSRSVLRSNRFAGNRGPRDARLVEIAVRSGDMFCP